MGQDKSAQSGTRLVKILNVNFQILKLTQFLFLRCYGHKVRYKYHRIKRIDFNSKFSTGSAAFNINNDKFSSGSALIGSIDEI
jgi:hypothetical protein